MFARHLRQTKTALLFSCAAVFVFVSGIARADNFSTRYGQATCSETIDNDTGRSLEFYGEINENEEPEIGFRYVIEFQKPLKINKCDEINRLAIQRMKLDLERQRIELELLRERQEAASSAATSDRLEPDW